MKIYLDTSNVEEIRKAQLLLKEAGSKLDGITTNPTTASQYALATRREPKDIFLEIASIVDGPISVETIGCNDYNPKSITVDQLVEEAYEIASWHPRFVVKIPCTPEGLTATRM
ncbi:MAG: transaldolase family protein, partial [Nanoarchaeota archaeon]